MTIVKNSEWLLRQPIGKIDPLLQGRLRSTKRPNPFPPIAALFDAYLQVTSEQTVTGTSLRTPEFVGVVQGFVGALHSDKFIDIPLRRSYLYARHFFQLLSAMGATSPVPDYALSTVAVTPDVAEWRRKFESASLDEEQVWLKGGWGGTSKSGASIYFPLYPVYLRVGRPFTEQLSNVLEVLVAGRRITALKTLADFCRFFENPSIEIGTDTFKDPYLVSELLTEFAHYYFRENKKRGVQISNAARAWKGSFVPIVSALIKAEAIAQPEPPLGNIRAGRIAAKGKDTNLQRRPDGLVVKTNLLTEIPLTATDGEVKEILFKEILDDFGAALTWAERDADELWRRHLEAKRLATLGKPRMVGQVMVAVGADWLTDPKNPESLANCAATYAKHGHPGSQPGQNTCRFYTKYGTVEIAQLLGLPINGALLPHAALLVANHCEITSSFLDSLELFDRDGKHCGLIETDAGSYLVGFKRRKGAKKAEQKILLSPRALEIVKQVIELTEPFRSYLRKQQDDAWRYLFLTAHGVGRNPKRQRFADQCSFPLKWGTDGLVNSFVSRTGMDSITAADQVRRFSLKNLRGSSALLVYLATGDIQKMAQALGHTRCDPKLLDAYLPEPFQRFFRGRWIRIFQTGMLCQALADSPYLLEASGFESMDQLDRFLDIHAIRNIPSYLASSDEAPKASNRTGSEREEVAFGISAGILTILVSIQRAVERSEARSSGRAVYWTEMSKRLCAYIRTLNDRPDLQHCLHEAEEHACPSKIEELMRE